MENFFKFFSLLGFSFCFLDKCGGRVYNREDMKYVYLDNAATTPLDTEVVGKMLPFLTERFGNADSPHAFGRKAMVAVDCARDTVAACLGAKPSEIYFTSGGTEADN